MNRILLNLASADNRIVSSSSQRQNGEKKAVKDVNLVVFVKFLFFYRIYLDEKTASCVR